MTTNPQLGLHHTVPGCGFTFGIDGGAVSGIQEIKAGTFNDTAMLPGSLTTLSINPNLIQMVSVPLTSVQLKGMSVTPVTLLAAPGAGKSYVIYQALFRMARTATAYANGGASVIQYHTSAVAATNTIAATVLTTAGAATTDTIPGVVGAAPAAQNDVIEITNATAPFITGTGTATVYLWYAIV